jgi:hypothetical protein
MFRRASGLGETAKFFYRSGIVVRAKPDYGFGPDSQRWMVQMLWSL